MKSIFRLSMVLLLAASTFCVTGCNSGEKGKEGKEKDKTETKADGDEKEKEMEEKK